ncbi:diphthamide synthesis protein [Candidatus Woesearchaeota archaeon]|nr:diphthamide synthesis protein [Candidatus Woesearchaeota archaeon]
MNYDLELDKAVAKVKDSHAKLVCIQLPEGLKPKAKEIADHIESNTDAKAIIWMGSCYGACDVPVQVKELGADLIIQWGHALFKKTF